MKNQKKVILQKVRKFILGSERPVTFNEVIVGIIRSAPLGTFPSCQIKLAIFNLVDNGEVKINRNWRLII